MNLHLLQQRSLNTRWQLWTCRVHSKVIFFNSQNDILQLHKQSSVIDLSNLSTQFKKQISRAMVPTSAHFKKSLQLQMFEDLGHPQNKCCHCNFGYDIYLNKKNNDLNGFSLDLRSAQISFFASLARKHPTCGARKSALQNKALDLHLLNKKVDLHRHEFHLASSPFCKCVWCPGVVCTRCHAHVRSACATSVAHKMCGWARILLVRLQWIMVSEKKMLWVNSGEWIHNKWIVVT